MASFPDRRFLGNFLGTLERLRARWRQWMGADRYRPEKHYMRGPGPKCAANSNNSTKARDDDRDLP
jgi:hypothetical protein